ncbi:hypothetical protein ES703_92782 [subsurface metagenome]
MLHKLISIFSDAKEPLLQISPANRSSAALTEASSHHLLISQYRLAARAPVNRSLAPISQTRLIQLQKEPLRPFIILRQAGNYLAAPVVDGTNAFKLATHIVYVLHRPGKRVYTPADSGIFRRQPEGIKPHRVKHIISLHPLKPSPNIRRSHGIPVPDMEVARGIGEHSQSIPLGAGGILTNLIQPVLSPFLLPLVLYFLRVISSYHLALPSK